MFWGKLSASLWGFEGANIGPCCGQWGVSASPHWKSFHKIFEKLQYVPKCEHAACKCTNPF